VKIPLYHLSRRSTPAREESIKYCRDVVSPSIYPNLGLTELS
jgi:hypothetical protein